MNHTEDDLRELLAERTAYGPGGDMDVAEIVRRGRRGMLARWGAGAVLAGAAATVAVWALPGAVTAPAPAPADQPIAVATPSSTTSAALPRVPEPPASLDGLPRIGGVINSMSATGTDIKVKPTSHAATVVVTCANPQSWVVTAVDGGQAGQVTRCQGGVARHAYSRRSLPSGWSNGRYSIRVWVFPPTELIGQTSLDGCAVVDKQKGTCNGRYAAQELVRYDVALELAADLGVRPGAWAAGVYDGS
ncbi:hypothetical protein ACIBHX_47350 [Nonomuraea sp. NPDC050536]|uniref:hypothetical protein n=1 Tax=Nonomuraea sp. NPDC050536 TaxID=3364366 RepID=UPI0037C59C08